MLSTSTRSTDPTENAERSKEFRPNDLFQIKNKPESRRNPRVWSQIQTERKMFEEENTSPGIRVREPLRTYFSALGHNSLVISGRGDEGRGGTNTASSKWNHASYRGPSRAARIQFRTARNVLSSTRIVPVDLT